MRLPLSPPPLTSLMEDFGALDPQAQFDLFANTRPLDHKGRYLHWDQLRHRTPPPGHTHRTWWLQLFIARRAAARHLPLLGKDNMPFWYSNVDPLLAALLRLDQEIAGHILIDDAVTSQSDRDRYLVNSLIEESIRSSQMEGANTTRVFAQELLRTGRAPRDRGERMIANNFAAMQTVEQWAQAGHPFDQERILTLHKIVTSGTLSEEADAGRIQTPDEDRVAVVAADQTIVHTPPPAAELPDRIERVCAFANGELDDGFIHPVVRAILLHFMIGYDHPFVDGNGRTARALFYWSLIRSGYWLASYLSISNLLHAAPSRYSRAYEHVTADLNDVTYFLLHQLDVLLRATDQLTAYIGRQIDQARSVAQLLRGHDDLNERQTALIGEALRDPGQAFTFERQRRQHRVSYGAARLDLLELERRGLLERAKVGKKFVFRPAPDLPDRLSSATR